MFSYFLLLRLLHADTQKAQARTREAQAIILESQARTREAQIRLREIQSGRALADAQLAQEQTRRAEAAEAQVKILQAQLDLNRKSRRYRRNRLRAAQQRRLCCTNCAKSL